MEKTLGSRSTWEKGRLQAAVAVKAYAGVMWLKDEQGQSPMAVEQQENFGANLLLDWVAVKMAVQARANCMLREVPEIFVDLEMGDAVRTKLSLDVPRQVNLLKVKNLNRWAGLGVV